MEANSTRLLRLVVTICAIASCVQIARAQYDYDRPPIRYSTAAVSDPIAKLQKKILEGKATLTRDGDFGYLKSTLQALNIPISSQTLVFSKTSFQRERISPASPRALYFDDDTYIGYCKDGEVLEVATTDPNIGTTFYTLDQDSKKPRFVRQTDNCLQCHAGSMTRDLPGLMMRSVFVDPSGQPILNAGTKLVTQETPFGDRFGGWYATGKHGDYDVQHHLGNLLGRNREDSEPVDPKAGANWSDLTRHFDTSAYLTPHSDLAALMVLAHQLEGHNAINRANYNCRYALRDAQVLNKALKRPADELSESTVHRIQSPAEELVKYMLFCNETPLAAPIEGSTNFTKEFAARGPHDSKGRSLRDLDLKTRLFKYPLSYLIYTSAFDGMPAQTKDYVYRRLHEVLTATTPVKGYEHLTPADRQAILEILRDTKKDLPDYWKN
jgi:hypothetical protein